MFVGSSEGGAAGRAALSVSHCMTIFQRIEAAVARRVLQAPDALVRSLTKRRWEVDGVALDRRAQYVFSIGRAAERSMPRMSPQDARRYYEWLNRALEIPPPEISRTVDLTTGLRSGERAGRAYYPLEVDGAKSDLPALVYFHGGGFTVGGIETHDVLCRRLCAAANCIVMSIDYRLAPEQPFPAAVQDCYDAYRWVVDRATDFGINPDRIGVGGDSAGGNLAAVVAILTREEGQPSPRVQLLIYPAAGTVAHVGRTKPELQRGYGLDAKTTRWFFDNYTRSGGADDPRVAPLLFESHRGLSPAIVATAQFDLLCGEGLEYVTKLREADVPVTHHHFIDLPHSFATMSVVPRAREAIAEIADSLRMALHAPRNAAAT